MHLKMLLTAAAATALIAGAAQAQMKPASSDPAKAAMPPMTDTSVNPMSPPADSAVVSPGVTTHEAKSANAMGVDASAVVTTSVVTNGPVADTPENRAKYGQPLSRAGKHTQARGN